MNSGNSLRTGVKPSMRFPLLQTTFWFASTSIVSFRKDSKIKLKRRVWTWLTTFGFDLVQLTGHAGPNKVLVAFSRASEPSCSGNRCAALEGNDGGNAAHSSV